MGKRLVNMGQYRPIGTPSRLKVQTLGQHPSTHTGAHHGGLKTHTMILRKGRTK